MLNERKLTKDELDKRQIALMGLLQNKRSLVKKYGKDAEKVMYGIATKQAKNKQEAMNLENLKGMIEAALQNPKKADLNKDGKLEIQLPNMEKAVELTELNAKQIEDAYSQLQKQQETGELDALGVAKAQLSTLETIVVALKTPAGKLAANIAAGNNYEKATQNAKNLAQQVQEGLEKVMTEKNYQNFSNLITQKISEGLTKIDTTSFEALGTSLADLAKEQLINVFQKIRTELLRQGPLTTNAVPSMAPQTTSSPINNMTPTTNATASINVENVEVIHKGTVEIRGLQETLNIASLSQSQLQELGTKIKSAMGSQFLATG